MLCSYGCGKEAIYQFKNGKWCCNKNKQACNSLKRKSKKPTINNNGFCSYGCGKEAIHQFKNGKWCCSFTTNKCNGVKQHNNGNTGYKCSKEKRQKISESKIGHKCSNKLREINRKRLLNGGALKMIKAIKKISNEEIRLRNMVKELHSNCEFQHPVLRYSLDIAIPDKKIAIEYDGYYHFDTEEHKEYHKLRQEKIEKEGWKFLRYTMFDNFPNKDQVKEDIKIILERKKEL